jgi:uncharacterized protein YabN with tetrapyrrole methylase and pyrophosphatase domain
VAPDHLTTLWIPELAAPVAGEVARLAELVRTLRQRCPWDREQTHRSLTRHLVEETYEVLEAIDELPPDAGAARAAGQPVGDDAGYAHLEEELGDLLFQVVLHATLAAEAGEFTLADVTVGIHDKLVRRHPHVFGDADADEAVANWEQAKMAEKGRASVLDGVTAGLPALLHAAKVQRRAASVGFDWENVRGARLKVSEELGELDAVLGDSPDGQGRLSAGRVAGQGRLSAGRVAGQGRLSAGRVAGQGRLSEELGDLLFSVVNVARHLDVDPETALRHATAKFARRFRRVEEGAGTRTLTPAEWDDLWEEAKRREA